MHSKECVERQEKVIEEFVPNSSLAPIDRALQTLRGVDLLRAEVGNVTRFESPRQLMAISVSFLASGVAAGPFFDATVAHLDAAVGQEDAKADFRDCRVL